MVRELQNKPKCISTSDLLCPPFFPDLIIHSRKPYSPSQMWLPRWRSPPANTGDARDRGLIPGSGRSSGGGFSNSLQNSCLKIPRTQEPGGIHSMGLQRVEHNSTHTLGVKFLSQSFSQLLKLKPRRPSFAA